MLVLVVGPSGAGKDTLLEAARQALADDPRFRFVRRVITRPAGAGGEAHEAVTEEEFATRVIEITAPSDVLAVRLASRGRESAIAVASRLARNVALPDNVIVHRVMNDASLEEGVERFLAALNRAASDVPR